MTSGGRLDEDEDVGGETVGTGRADGCNEYELAAAAVDEEEDACIRRSLLSRLRLRLRLRL